MNTSLVIYFASIADGIQFWLGLMSFAVMVSNFVLLMVRCHAGEYNVPAEPFLWKAHIPLAMLAASLAFACAATPDPSDIYKIAGVTGQQKAQIDAAGKVVGDSAKKATP